MKKQSLSVLIISIIIVFLGNLTGLFGEQGDIIVGIVATALVMLLKKFSNSGVWLTGMSTTFWIVSTMSLIVQVAGNVLSYADVLNLSDSVLAAIGKGTILLNAIIIGLGTTTPMNSGDKTLLSVKK